jgi:type I restriction enzyme S subunit
MSAQVRPGYKLTEVGVIPEDWAYVDLKSLGFDISDGNYSSKYPKASDFKYLGVPFIRANNIGAMTICDVDMRFISAEQHSELLKGHLKKNDILITTRGEIGQIALVPDCHVGSNINAQIVRINTEGSKIFNLFLAQFLTSKIATEQVVALQTGSALKQLPVGRLLQLKILVPPHVEQCAIAAALSDMDALISGLDQLIAKKRDIKQAAMQQLLTGQQRLPGFSGEWDVKKIGDLCDFQNGTSLEYLFNAVDGLRVISIGNYSTAGNYIQRDLYINNCYRKVVEKFVLNKGDLAMSLNDKTSTGAILGRVLLIEIDNEFVFNQRTMRLRPKSGAVSGFLHHAINGDYLHGALVSLAKPGTQIYINTDDVIDLLVPIPAVAEQTAIATILSDMDSELATLKIRRDKARQLKQGMMQELLSGNIRLNR